MTEWVARRSEQIEILNERSLIRKSTFEVSIEKLMALDLPLKSDHVVVLPLLRVSRCLNSSIEVLADRGFEPHRVAFDEERAWVGEGFRETWKNKVPADLLERSVDLITQPYDRDKIINDESKPRTKAEIETRDVLKGVGRSEVLNITEMRMFSQQLLKWRDNYLLMLEVPLKHDTQYATLAVRLTEEVPPPFRFPPGTRRMQKLNRVIRGFVAGTFSVAVSVPVRVVVGRAQGTHFELKAVRGFRAVQPLVHVQYFVPEDDEMSVAERKQLKEICVRSWRGLSPQQTFRDDDGVPEIGHVYTRRLPLAVRDAYFSVSLLAYRTGTIVESVLASWLVAGIMTAYFVRLDRDGFNTVKAFQGSSTNFAAVLLPAIVSLVVTVAFSREPNRIASRSLLQLRLTLGVSAASALAAAVLLALRDQGTFARVVWWVIFLISIFAALKLTSGLVVHSWRLSKTRRRKLERNCRVQDKRDRDEIARVAEIVKRVDERKLGTPEETMTPLRELNSVDDHGLSAEDYRRCMRGYKYFAQPYPAPSDVDERVAAYKDIFEIMDLSTNPDSYASPSEFLVD